MDVSHQQKMDRQTPLVELLLNHLVLPPQLPHSEDPNVPELEKDLIERLILSSQHLRDLPGNQFRRTWDSIWRSLEATKRINADGGVDRSALIQEFRHLDHKEFVVIYVRAQNCALFVRRSHDSIYGPSITFEAFEASARNEDVLATENALQWDFPGSAAVVSLSTFLEDGFISNLASFLEHASRESVKDFAAHSFKAGTTVFEYRNTAEPCLITSMLMAVLQGNGRRQAPMLLRKKVRDDCLWKNASKPWRRLPYWLILRVSVSRYLALEHEGDVGRVEYKFLLVHFLQGFLIMLQASSPNVQRLDFLRKKICRRLAKLDMQKEASRNLEVLERFDYLFCRLEPAVKSAVRQASTFINACWKQQCLSTSKSIPILPQKAFPEDLRLDLRVSRQSLQSVLAGYDRPRRREDHRGDTVTVAAAAKKHLNTFSRSQFKLVKIEAECKGFVQQTAVASCEATCSSASSLISRYIQAAKTSSETGIADVKFYSGVPELNSIMILNIMEVWVRMDEVACTLYPLLREYHPLFFPDMLDVLLISHFADMERILKIQSYLQRRVEGCEGAKMSIFHNPARGCFGQRAYDEFPEAHQFVELHQSIEAWAEKVRLAKEKEWKSKSLEYTRLSKRTVESSCVFRVDENNPLSRGYHDPCCPRCDMLKQLSRMKIQAYEHPLPSDVSVAKAVVFELNCPREFATYRDTTWRIISQLALPWHEELAQPKCILRDYQQLANFQSSTQSSFVLASTTKPFLTTHYSWLDFPVDWESGKNGVCRPNGLRLSSFDYSSSMWLDRRPCRLTFGHHVKLELPKSSPFSKVLQDSYLKSKLYGPSSYEIMATASTAPSGVNIHEYLAFQTVASGISRRWLSILTELASANLNFSNEATMLLLRHLTLQCGPPRDMNDPFRLIHAPFLDETFCEKLIEQLRRRLESLSANWREISLMEIIITLALRLVDFAEPADLPLVSHAATCLLLEARTICLRWFRLLIAESYQAANPEASRRCQEYALWAALLCKQTFAALVQHPAQMGDDALGIFLQSSIVVQNNLVIELNSLPHVMQQAIIRDLRMSYCLRHLIADAIMSRPCVLASSLREIWAEEEGCTRNLSSLSLNGNWIACLASAGNDAEVQRVYYNFVEGLLLVDGQPIGKLPKDPTQAPILNELLGNQALLTYPSRKPGMQYCLCLKPQGFQVHIGYGQDGNMIVRAFRSPYSLQLIPRDTFRQGNSWDLPGPLLDGCLHWLNLRNGEVYITKQASPWPNENFSGYVLDTKTQSCTRSRYYKGKHTLDTVVSTYSPLFVRATRILETFEYRRHILILQPGGGRNVQVELPRLNILFFVNDKNLLQSPQLQCEIDPNQDAGTWYGLRSKLVCRNVTNPMHQAVLVPLGNLTVEPQGCHVSVRIEPNGSYGRFTINKTLERLDCAAEPVLVYMKALLHAYTSFLLPDPLTSRTGAEEAIQWLQSGISQPWTPLGRSAIDCLMKIANLTPTRTYYPADLKVMRTDNWTESIPVCLQCSLFQPIVEQILRTSNVLARLDSLDYTVPQLSSVGEPHLHARCLAREQVLERPSGDTMPLSHPRDQAYESRDRPSLNNIRHTNVLEVIHLLRKNPQNLSTTKQLAQILATGNVIGGFRVAFDKVALNDRLKVDLIQSWGSLVLFARENTNRFALMYLLGLISFRLDVDMSLVRALIAFASWEELRTLDLPPWDEYVDFQSGKVPQLEVVVQMLKPFRVPYAEPDAAALEEFSSAKQRKKLHTERSKYESRVDDDIKTFANFLLKQWPCLEPSASGLEQSVLLDIGAALDAVRPEWTRLRHNLDLSKHLAEVQTILDRRMCEERFDPTPLVLSEDVFPTRFGGEVLVHLDELMMKPIAATGCDRTPLDLQREVQPASLRNPKVGVTVSKEYHCTVDNNQSLRHPYSETHSGVESAEKIRLSSILELKDIASRLRESRSSVKQRYSVNFQHSLEAYQKLRPAATSSQIKMYKRDLEIEQGHVRVSEVFSRLKSAFDTPTSHCSARRIEWLKTGNLWPVISKSTILGQLRSTAAHGGFGCGMRETLVGLGVEITQLQRQIRLHDLVLKREPGRYAEEDANEGHSNWIPSDRPDWLLLEVESNMMIRPVQIDVALATMSPASESNSVLQMNMGQGKTSCIIPMVAAAIADGKQLVRVIVPKALLQQTAQLLHARLGGILGRQLRHVGFSRRTPTTQENIRAFLSVHEDMLKSSGIMLCQPDHLMSFKLSGRQRLLDNQIAQAKPMIKVQSWLERVSRDILDESDYTLAVRTQLIYPSGSQMTVDGHPHRWQVIEAVLRLVDGHMVQLPYEFQNSIMVMRRPGGGFPLIHFLRSDVEAELMCRVTADIFQSLGGILPMATNALPLRDKVAIKDFISSPKPRIDSIERVRKIRPDMPSIRQTVYLLRGLLVNRILMMALKKWWNVEYGLHPKRDPIAVPFSAKGVPSDQSEWGHPDVAILFTCLAFYYDGINLSQLKQSLEHILKSDDPSTEYDRWTHSAAEFPSSLRAWNSINVDDEAQLSEIWKSVRYSPVVIEYFLNNFVFPRHAKQFKVKLQSNGWDIPLFSLAERTEKKGKVVAKSLTTGFSGTNDNRTMLPLNIKQQDLPSLLHTSAEVLTYLLHPRNRDCVLFSKLRRDPSAARASERDLLFGLRRMSIRVLIDAGAQILEMDNLTLAEQWLKIDGGALGALFFDQGNKPWVVTKQGKKTPLLASPFADDLSQCLVYLDEAHTRGTDLRLPAKARGALTLRLGQTKDHTVQAAMRLRQLGTTQAVTFFIPPEVHQNIADLQGKTTQEPLSSSDVIEWLLDNTCDAIEQFQPLYYSQGMDWCRRMQAELDNRDFLTDKLQREVYIDTIKQEEQQTLQQLYDPKPKNRVNKTLLTSRHEGLRGFIRELNSQRKTFQDTGSAVHGSTLQEVEQEREVAFEVESVRQVKKPHQYPACSYPGLHPSLESFARTGRIPADAHYFTHIFNSLSKTTVGRKFKVSREATESKLFVTGEFDRTIKLNLDLSMDNFIRPVNWLLWSPQVETAVVINPEEAEALLPIMRDRSIQKAPEWLRVELGIFAGRLYFDWSEYKPMCTLLCIEEGAPDEREVPDWVVMDEATDDVPGSPQAQLQKPSDRNLVERPLTFLQEWLTVRRRGQDFAHTPMGFVSQGKILQEGHVFFQEATDASRCQTMCAPVMQEAQENCQDNGEDDYGVDDMGANEGVDGAIIDERFVYDECELDVRDGGYDFGGSTSEGGSR